MEDHPARRHAWLFIAFLLPGGAMTSRSEPEFRLSIILPKKA